MSVQWQEQELYVNGARLHVARSGSGMQPPVVLVHGFSDNGRCWPQLSRELAEDYDVVLPDARGHGLSARVRPGEKIDLAADLAGIIRALELEQPVVMGHSMGAASTAQLGARFPELVRALVLEDPPWRPQQESPALVKLSPKDLESANELATAAAQPSAAPPPSEAQPLVNPLQQWIDSLNGLSADEIARDNRLEHPAWPKDVLLRWSEAKLQLDRGFFLWEEAHVMRWPEVVDAIRCPTLLITADPERGGILSPEMAQEVVARNPAFTLVHIDGVGHHIRFEAYERYREAVLAFLERL